MEIALRRKLDGGTFQNVSESRSKAMRAVRGRGNKTTEQRLRFAFVRNGIAGWELHADIPGRPDFYFAEYRLAVFVDGCFWHGCPKCGHVPNTNRPFWSEKIARNRARDAKTNRRLRSSGISVVRFWEHELANDPHKCVRQVRSRLQQRRGGFCTAAKVDE